MGQEQRVSELMSRSVITVAPQASAEHAAWLLTEYAIGAVPVVDDGEQVVGIVTEGDLVRRGELSGCEVAEVMADPVLTVADSATILDARGLMRRGRVGRLPVVDALGRLVGILSPRDMLVAGLPGDAELRRRVIDRVIDVGGEVYEASADHGAVHVRGRVVLRSEIAVVERAIRALDGVSGLDASFVYTVDDRGGLVRG
jgi:CBS-domain-containing membrane protein